MSVATAASPIKERRREENLSQRELAQRVGCAVSTIRFIEENWTGYSPDLGSRIAAALGVESLDQLR